MAMNETLRKNNRTFLELENNLKIKEASLQELFENLEKTKKSIQ
jgi:hypothetical protein